MIKFSQIHHSSKWTDLNEHRGKPDPRKVAEREAMHKRGEERRKNAELRRKEEEEARRRREAERNRRDNEEAAEQEAAKQEKKQEPEQEPKKQETAEQDPKQEPKKQEKQNKPKTETQQVAQQTIKQIDAYQKDYQRQQQIKAEKYQKNKDIADVSKSAIDNIKKLPLKNEADKTYRSMLEESSTSFYSDVKNIVEQNHGEDDDTVVEALENTLATNVDSYSDKLYKHISSSRKEDNYVTTWDDDKEDYLSTWDEFMAKKGTKDKNYGKLRDNEKKLTAYKKLKNKFLAGLAWASNTKLGKAAIVTGKVAGKVGKGVYKTVKAPVKAMSWYYGFLYPDLFEGGGYGGGGGFKSYKPSKRRK